METTFSVSNTDVITMLVVKNREALQAKRSLLLVELAKETVTFNKKLNELYKKRIAKVDRKIVNAFEALVKALNPKLPFKIRIGDVLSYYHGHYGYGNDAKLFKYKQPTLTIVAEFEEEDCEKVVGWEGDEPFICFPFKVDIEATIPEKLFELNSQINEVDALLRNEAALKEKLIAQVTENALLQMPELQHLTANIPLLAIGG